MTWRLEVVQVLDLLALRGGNYRSSLLTTLMIWVLFVDIYLHNVPFHHIHNTTDRHRLLEHCWTSVLLREE
jgi:hypothetical protein